MDIDELLAEMDEPEQRGLMPNGRDPWKRVKWTAEDERQSRLFHVVCEWCDKEFYSACNTAHFCCNTHKFKASRARKKGTWLERRPKLYRESNLVSANKANPNHQRRTG